MRRLALLAGLALSVAVLAVGPAGAQATTGVTVEIAPASASLLLGESFEIDVVVTNRSETMTPPLAVHIDVTDPGRASSVDPEDWTATLTRHAGSLRPDTQQTLRWSLQPISGGRFVLYVVALDTEQTPDALVAASNGIPIDVTERRSLNPGGVVPVVLAVPILLGAALVVRRRLTAGSAD